MRVVKFIRSVWEANHVVVWRIVRNGHAQVVDLKEYRLLLWSNGSKKCETYSSVRHYEWMRRMIDDAHEFAHIQLARRFQSFRIYSDQNGHELLLEMSN